MTVPGWVWAVSAAGLLAVAAAEVMLTGRSGDQGFLTRRAVRWVVIYVSLAVIFGLGVAVMAGWVPASQFYAGYLTAVLFFFLRSGRPRGAATATRVASPAR